MTWFIILSVTIGWSVCLASTAESSSNSLCWSFTLGDGAAVQNRTADQS